MKLRHHHKTAGFTLIEVMLVVALIGFLAAFIRVAVLPQSPEKALAEQAQKFVALCSVAADFALLNNVELGISITDNSYEFLIYKDEQWVSVPGKNFITQVTLPEPMQLQLMLDDLPIEQPVLADAEQLTEQQKYYAELRQADEYAAGFDSFEDKQQVGKNIQKDTQEKAEQVVRYPQIYLLSSGELTPFRVIFRYAEPNHQQPWVYQVTGLYSLPLQLEGPITDE
jgi:general secretion pathway protein H